MHVRRFLVRGFAVSAILQANRPPNRKNQPLSACRPDDDFKGCNSNNCTASAATAGRCWFPAERAVGIDRSKKSQEKLAAANEDRRKLHQPWILNNIRNERPVDLPYQKPLAALFNDRSLGNRYRRDLVDVRRINQTDDMPSAVVGQLGVVAINPIAADTLIGVYEGRILRPADRFKYWKAADYFMNAALPFLPDDPKCPEPDWKHPPMVDFTVDPSYPYGNGAMEYINDYRLDVIKPDDAAANPFGRCNVFAQQVFSKDHEPWICIISSKPIGVGQPLLMDYGNGYWQAKLRQFQSQSTEPRWFAALYWNDVD